MSTQGLTVHRCKRYLRLNIWTSLYCVAVPPDRMEIMDLATGQQLLRRQDGGSVNSENNRGSETTTTTTVVGPYVEGSDVRVRCRVYGGQYMYGLVSATYNILCYVIRRRAQFSMS